MLLLIWAKHLKYTQMMIQLQSFYGMIFYILSPILGIELFISSTHNIYGTSYDCCTLIDESLIVTDFGQILL